MRFVRKDVRDLIAHQKNGQTPRNWLRPIKWLAEIVMTSKNGGSLMIGFNGTIRGHVNYMPVVYDGKGIYRSIIEGTEARVKPLPKDIFK